VAETKPRVAGLASSQLKDASGGGSRGVGKRGGGSKMRDGTKQETREPVLGYHRRVCDNRAPEDKGAIRADERQERTLHKMHRLSDLSRRRCNLCMQAGPVTGAGARQGRGNRREHRKAA